MTTSNKNEWSRGKYLKTYELLLGEYMVKTVLDHAVGSSLLDLACGNGILTNLMSKEFTRTVGVDASARKVTEARQYSSLIVQGLAEEFQASIPFSTITAIHLLEHIDDAAAVIRQAARNMTQDGVFIAFVPNAMAVSRRIARLMGSLKDEFELSPFDRDIAGHKRLYDLPTLRRHIEDGGLKVIRTGGVFYKSLSSAQINWLLEQGPWAKGGYGWGRVGEEKSKDWMRAFCDACYEYGKEWPEDCNVIYAVAAKQGEEESEQYLSTAQRLEQAEKRIRELTGLKFTNRRSVVDNQAAKIKELRAELAEMQKIAAESKGDDGGE